VSLPQAAVLRLAVQNLANAPQAQRRYVQLGLMPKAIGALEGLGADPRAIEGGDEFSDEGVAMIIDLRAEVMRQMEAVDDLMELKRSAPREFLFSDALENEAWEGIRQSARRTHTEISGEVSALLAVMAK
jgi:hypothetical protein